MSPVLRLPPPPATALVLLLAALLVPAGTRARGEVPWPPVADLAARLKSEIPDLAIPAEGETNATHYLRSLAPRVLAAPGTPKASAGPALARAQMYGGQAAYLRVSEVDPGLAASFQEALGTLSRTGTVAGVVLDLRYAGGSDFSAAAAAAAIFAQRPIEPLRLGSQAFPVSVPAQPLALPVLVLVHGSTRGAAEALAAAVRATARASLIIGSPTAGEARSYKPVAIADGLALRVAAEPLVLPDGRAFPLTGLTPDLAVPVDPDDEARYYTNEFLRVGGGRSVRDSAGFRLNEAELVRRMRGPHGRDRRGVAPAPEAPVEAGEPAEKRVQDPVLARALDLIDGYSMTQGAGAQPGSDGNSR